MVLRFVETVVRLTRSSSMPFGKKTRPRLQPYPCRPQFESLETRNLLASIPFSAPIPLSVPDSQRFGETESPYSIDESGRVLVSHARTDTIAGEATEFEYFSDANELVLFQLNRDGFERDEIEVVDADGIRQSGWSVFEVGRLASTSQKPGSLLSLQSQLSDHLAFLEMIDISIDGWLSNSISPDYSTWIVGETGKASRLTLRIPPINQDSQLVARAYTGMTFLHDDTEAPHSIDIKWDSRNETRESTGIAGRIGVADSEILQFTEDFESEIADIDTRLTTRIEHDATVQIESTDESNHSLVLETQSPKPIEYVDGVVFDYNSTTGDLSVQAATPIRAIEIKSETGLFGGPAPEIIAGNVFNVFRPTKLFALVLQGTSEIGFGQVLPAGLTREMLEQDLVVQGAYLPGGAMNQIVLSVDGEIPFSTAETNSFIPQEISIASSANASLTAEWGDILSFDYSLTGVHAGLDVPQSDWSDASVRIRTRINAALLLRTLDPCESICRAEFRVPAINDESSHAVQIKFENDSNDTRLEIDNIEVKSTIDQVQTFKLTAHAGQILKVKSSLFGNMQGKLTDSAGNLVTYSDSFELTGPTKGSEVYQLELFATAPLPASYFLIVDSQPSSSQITDYRFSTYLSEDQLTVSWPFAVDVRTCRLSDFEWNGPEFQWIDYKANGDISLVTSSPVEDGYYSLSIRDGACVSPAGLAMSNQTAEIDFVRPQLVDFPLRDREWLRPGDSSFSMRFDEPIRQWSDGIGTLEQSDGTFVDFVQLRFSNKIVLGHVGNLAPGEYRLQFDFAAGDASWNQPKTHYFDFQFVVSETPPDGLVTSRFDVDRNGRVDPLDLDFLRAIRSSFSAHAWSQYDLDGDSRVTEEDVDLLLREGLQSRMGDVDLDGDFDQDDLDFLASLQPGSITDSRWALGDFNGDGLFDSSDMVLAFKDGNVEEARSLSPRGTAKRRIA